MPLQIKWIEKVCSTLEGADGKEAVIMLKPTISNERNPKNFDSSTLDSYLSKKPQPWISTSPDILMLLALTKCVIYHRLKFSSFYDCSAVSDIKK